MDIIFSEPVWNHTYTLKCIPKDTANQRITECNIDISPENPVHQGKDSFGNAMLYGNVAGQHRIFRVDVTGEAVTGILNDGYIQEDMDLAVYKYQTPLTRPGENLLKLLECCRAGELAPLARNMEEKNSGEDNSSESVAVREKVCNYMHAVYESMQYEKGLTDIDTTAEAALTLGKGVCQDFAHILLSLCREDKIPARYVVGMFLGEGESHAWVEIFDGEMWVGFDPTNNRQVEDTYIKISHGRDYRDCSINRGVFTGQAQQKQRILVEVTERA